MKRLETFVNEQEYKLFTEKAKNAELSEYALLKRILLDYLCNDVESNSDDVARPYIKKVKALKKQQQWALTAIFVLSCYFVVSLTYILLF